VGVTRNKYSVLGIILFILFLLVMGGSRFYLDWLWFKSLDYGSVFMTVFLSKISIRIVVAALLFIFFFINLWLTRGVVRGLTETETGQKILRIQEPLLEKILTGRFVVLLYLAASAFLAIIFSSVASGQWELFQKFIQASSFGVKDPLFQLDIGFYVFKLPLYRLLYQLMVTAIVITGILLGVIYFVTKSIDLFTGNLTRFSWPKMHFLSLIGLFFLAKAWGYKLAGYNLLFSPRGVVLGAGYTDVHANLLAMKVFMVLAVITGLAILVNVFSQQIKLALGAIAVFVVAWVALGVIYPSAVQKFIVEPNEYEREKQYISYNINSTKQAYGLERIERQKFSADGEITAAALKENANTLINVRLWDWRPLIQTFNQLQGLRPYYDFVDVDIDRYTVDGQYRQVMLAPRELDQTKLPDRAKTWINQRLKYTHGYGVAASPVNEVTGEGLPKYFIKDIPPTSTSDLKVTEPRIYFGEKTDGYVFVKNRAQEFDYPKGDQNAYTTYHGTGGVPISSFWRRLVMAVGLGDYKILLANDLTNDSRALFYRNIQQRVAKLAPFLRYDGDPYLVVDQGRLFWIQDAYTTTNMYPYAEPTDGIGNYIRNSVKVLIDAYNGTTTFYVSDQSDPIIRTYEKIFPGMFVAIDKMPGTLRQHIRYPEDLFVIQSQIYATYHMGDPRVFFNKEDKWSFPSEMVGDQKQVMTPYYNIMSLPGSEKPEYVLMLPFTPLNKDNMVAWLAARSDGPNYGKILVYEFPKQQTVFGPMQVEARIDQDSAISQQLTLWDQRGSRTYRGNLLVLPMNNSLLYVEPLYLQSEQSKLPELRRVIVVYQDRLVMEETFDAALKKVFGIDYEGSPNTEPGAAPPASGTIGSGSTVNELARQANSLYLEAQKLLQSGDWAGYGDRMNKLAQVLKDLEVSSKQK